MSKTIQSQSETLSFGAETGELLKLVTHSLYSNKEIFLRELISNASDAADKLRYQGLTDSKLYENDANLKIWIDVDKKLRTITLRDNGIGMSREDIIEHLGTIAKSGTRAFRELLKGDQNTDSQLIGQFGVGFYSAFMVADNIIVRSRRAGMKADQGVYWESEGNGKYTVKNINKKDRGTEIVLHIKKESQEFLDPRRLRAIIIKYSDHVVLPIVMKKIDEKTPQKTAPKEDAVGENKKSEIMLPEEEVVNRARALWKMSKKDIKEEEYHALYKHIAHDFEAPLTFSHNQVEGKLEYTSLLFIPARAPFNLWNREHQHGLKLYVKRVFIMDDAESLLPLYLRFVKGIVDSNDLPLNISREILQSNKIIDNIKSACVKRVLSMLEKMATSDDQKYEKFWKEFGQVLKEGPAEDYANKDRIAKLLRFSSTYNDSQVQQNISLTDYVARMKKNQDKIYYIVADTFTAAKNSPLLEVFRKKGIEVLLMYDRVDEWLMGNLSEFEGKTLQSIAKGSLDLDKIESADKEEKAADTKEWKDVLKDLKSVLEGKVKDVCLSNRLIDSPTCVVFDENEMSGHMQRLLASAGQGFGRKTLPILELNPRHPLVLKARDAKKQKKDFTRWANILLSQALLAEGEQLENPAAFVKDFNVLLLEANKN